MATSYKTNDSFAFLILWKFPSEALTEIYEHSERLTHKTKTTYVEILSWLLSCELQLSNLRTVVFLVGGHKRREGT
jgi:hypothetical protein